MHQNVTLPELKVLFQGQIHQESRLSCQHFILEGIIYANRSETKFTKILTICSHEHQPNINLNQCCGSKYIEFGPGSRILAQFGSGSRALLSTLKEKNQNNFREK